MTGQYIAVKAYGSGGRIVLLRLGHFGFDVSDLVCGGRHRCKRLVTSAIRMKANKALPSIRRFGMFREYPQAMQVS